MTFKTFYFEIIVGSRAVLGNNATEIPYTRHQVSPSGNITHNCSSVSQPGHGHWWNPSTLFRLHQFYLHSSMNECLYLIQTSLIKCVDSCDRYHHLNDSQRCSLATKPTSFPPRPTPSPKLMATTHLFSTSVIFSFQECHINVIKQYVTSEMGFFRAA